MKNRENKKEAEKQKKSKNFFAYFLNYKNVLKLYQNNNIINWKKYIQKIKTIKFKEVKIFDSTFYFRYTVRIILILILIWLGMVTFFNWNSLVGSVSLSKYFFITQDVDSIRYLLSSAFQGLSALFALTISISFVVAQLASSYSPRLVMKIVKKKWFLFGLILFVMSLSYNLFLLSFVTDETVIGFKLWLLFGGVLDITSIIFIIPFIFLFIRTIDPWELSQGLAKKFDNIYFEKMVKKREVDDTLPLFQVFVIKGLENGDLDMVSSILGTFFNQLEKFITNENYHLVATYFKPFFYKLIRKAIEYRENSILEQLIFSLERVQNKITSSDFMKVSKFQDEYSSSMPHIIIFLMNESIKFGDGEILGVGFGALSRLEEKIAPLMPADDDISEIKSMKERQKKNYGYKNTQEQYDNRNISKYIEDVFLAEEIIKLTETAIKMQDEKSVSQTIRHIFWARHYILRLDETRAEIKKWIFRSLPYHLKILMMSASKNGINISDCFIMGVEESFDEFIDLEIIIGEYYISLMCDALRLIIEKGFFVTSPEFVFNMAGATGRGIASKKRKEVKKMMEELINTLEGIVTIIDKRSKKSVNTEYEKIRNEIASQLKSFQNWGLKEVDVKMEKELIEFLAKNWDANFLKSLEK